MNSSLRARLQNLTHGFWFVPGVITAGLGGLAFVLIAIDRATGPLGVEGAFDGDATAARSILSTIAGSLITVAGLAFTLTIVTLQLVSSQFTPRALRNFLGDRINQVTAGSFVGIFLYCLLVLRSVRTSLETKEGFVPALSVSTAIALAVVALALLLTFIHHLARSIQVSNIAARITRATLGRVDRLFPEDYGQPLPPDSPGLLEGWEASRSPVEVHASRPGYIQIIDVEELVERLGSGDDLRVRVDVAPGDLVTPTTRLVRVWGLQADEPAGRVHSAIRIDSDRDLAQDVGYGIRQLTDIALRALSPGINDPTTAIDCIAYIRSVLERLAGRAFPSDVRRLAEHNATVSLRVRSFQEYLDGAFVEIGRYAHDNARVAIALLEACGSIARIAEAAGASERAEAIRDVAKNVAEPAAAAASPADVERLEDALAASLRA